MLFIFIHHVRRCLILAVLLCFAVHNVSGQFSLSGLVLEEGKDKNPIQYALVVVNDNEQWAVTDAKGAFQLKSVVRGDVRITISCLGYAKKTFELNVTGNMDDLIYYLPEDNLALDEVVITAKSKSNEMATSYVIDRAAIDHAQMKGVADITSLLPGGQTRPGVVQYMATNSPQTIALRAGATLEGGGASFGTAIEVDGVRMSNNALMNIGIGSTTPSFNTAVAGVDTRNIATSNIESVELITGIPSAAYGDLTSGVVKINTRQGKTPYQVEMKTSPNTQSFSFNKGFGLGRNAGVLNISLDRLKSVSNPMSPYTSYVRNNMSVTYNNTFNQQRKPLEFTFGVTGNTGGYNSENDPDMYVGTYAKVNDNSLTLRTKLKYQLNLPWITNLEISASTGYSDKMIEEKRYRTSASTIPALHGMEEGYFVSQNFDEHPDAPVVNIIGAWYQVLVVDNKELDMQGSFKARWIKKTGPVRNNVELGTDFSRSGNLGKGCYYKELRYAPDWREYRYDQLPYTNNLALILEDNISVNIRKSLLRLMIGARSDMTMIKGSEYGTVSSLSPRLNAKYSFAENKDRWIDKVTLSAGYGKSVKLPSFNVLYPQPAYSDQQVYGIGTSANENLTVYHIMPRLPEFNPNLKWTHINKMEAGMEFNIKNVFISFTVYQTKTINNYNDMSVYEPYSYSYTDRIDSPVKPENRRVTVDRTTGVVTLSDITGEYSDMILPNNNKKAFKSTSKPINADPVLRRGVEWRVNFGKIQALQTSVNWDGNYYYYKSLDETITPYVTTQRMADGNPSKYIAFYVGPQNTAYNGSIRKVLKSNVTLTTHIPAIRFIVSLKIEGSLYEHSQNISEYQGKPLGFVLDSNTDVFPSETRKDIYAGDQFVAKYPLYYMSLDDNMATKIPFEESFRDAYINDRALFTELNKMIAKTNFDYNMNPDKISAYWSANINVTKEIKDIATISFYANNFLNNMQNYKSSQRDMKTSLYSSSRIPFFNYGMSLTLKLKTK